MSSKIEIISKKIKLEKEKYKKENGPFVEIKFKKLMRKKSHDVIRDRRMRLRDSFDDSQSMKNNGNSSIHDVADVPARPTLVRHQ